MEVTRNSTIGDVLDHDEGTAVYFSAMGMECLGCPGARSESIEQACAVHNTDPDELVKQLNGYLSKSV